MTLPPPILLIAAIGFTIHVALTVAIFRSAVDNGMNGEFWAALYFFTLPFGVLAFLIARTVAASGSTVSGMTIADPNRKRTVDARRDFSRPRTVVDMLPRPSRGFHDNKLKEMVCLSEWEKALEHTGNMQSMALGDGNRELAEDYRRLRLWMMEKQNPFEV